jgi:protoporphyrinogen oxidase
MAALGAEHRLQSEGLHATLYDKNAFPGGHTATFEHASGFTFDDGCHISFTREKRLQELFAQNVRGEYETVKAYVDNYFQGRWIKHPVQSNLRALPDDLLVDCLDGLVRALLTPKPTSFANYAEWLIAVYGRTFAETFPMPYGLRYHTTSAENMSIDWLGPRLHQPSLREVLEGAIKSATPDVHYVDYFRYPTRGGFAAFLRPFFARADLRLEHKVLRIDPERREILFANGVTTRYRHLISSMPLPSLVECLPQAPLAVQAASRALACTTCVTVNLGLDAEGISPAQWRYFYDDDFIFTRLSCPHLLSPHTVPPGHSSIQAEVYFSRKYRPLTEHPDVFIKPVIADLRRCGMIPPTAKVVYQGARVIEYANVIYDLERAANLRVVHDYLAEADIHWCGRYGCWDHTWTDEAFMSGEAAAQQVLDGRNPGEQMSA